MALLVHGSHLVLGIDTLLCLCKGDALRAKRSANGTHYGGFGISHQAVFALIWPQAVALAQDLKLGHYVKMPPGIPFWAQMVPTLVSTLTFIGLLQYQLHIDMICTPETPSKLTCPATNTFFTSAVLWGTVRPERQFGAESTYSTLLVDSPVSIVIVLMFWGLGTWFPKSNALRSVHLVVLISGALGWAPCNLSYIWPAVPVAAHFWLFVRRNYLAFWSRYDYVLSAAFAAGIARGCEGVAGPLMPMSKGQIFAPKPDGQY